MPLDIDYIYLFLFIFIYSISIAPLQASLYSEALPTTARTLCWSFHAEAHRVTVSDGLAQGPYVAPRAGFEPTTLRPQANTYPLYHNASQIACMGARVCERVRWHRYQY